MMLTVGDGAPCGIWREVVIFVIRNASRAIMAASMWWVVDTGRSPETFDCDSGLVSRFDSGNRRSL